MTSVVVDRASCFSKLPERKYPALNLSESSDSEDDDQPVPTAAKISPERKVEMSRSLVANQTANFWQRLEREYPPLNLSESSDSEDGNEPVSTVTKTSSEHKPDVPRNLGANLAPNFLERLEREYPPLNLSESSDSEDENQPISTATKISPGHQPDTTRSLAGNQAPTSFKFLEEEYPPLNLSESSDSEDDNEPVSTATKISPEHKPDMEKSLAANQAPNSLKLPDRVCPEIDLSESSDSEDDNETVSTATKISPERKPDMSNQAPKPNQAPSSKKLPEREYPAINLSETSDSEDDDWAGSTATKISSERKPDKSRNLVPKQTSGALRLLAREYPEVNLSESSDSEEDNQTVSTAKSPPKREPNISSNPVGNQVPKSQSESGPKLLQRENPKINSPESSVSKGDERVSAATKVPAKRKPKEPSKNLVGNQVPKSQSESGPKLLQRENPEKNLLKSSDSKSDERVSAATKIPAKRKLDTLKTPGSSAIAPEEPKRQKIDEDDDVSLKVRIPLRFLTRMPVRGGGNESRQMSGNNAKLEGSGSTKRVRDNPALPKAPSSSASGAAKAPRRTKNGNRVSETRKETDISDAQPFAVYKHQLMTNRFQWGMRLSDAAKQASEEQAGVKYHLFIDEAKALQTATESQLNSVVKVKKYLQSAARFLSAGHLVELSRPEWRTAAKMFHATLVLVQQSFNQVLHRAPIGGSQECRLAILCLKVQAFLCYRIYAVYNREKESWTGPRSACKKPLNGNASESCFCKFIGNAEDAHSRERQSRQSECYFGQSFAVQAVHLWAQAETLTEKSNNQEFFQAVESGSANASIWMPTENFVLYVREALYRIEKFNGIV